MASWLRGRTRKVPFEVTLTIHECTNVPLTNAALFVKWKTKTGTKYSGYTERVEVVGNRSSWEQAFIFSADMQASREDSMLRPFTLRLSVRQETKGGKDHARLGVVEVDLACFADQESMTRRYLLDEAISNSVLTVSLAFKCLATGDAALFRCPGPDGASGVSAGGRRLGHLDSMARSLEIVEDDDGKLTLHVTGRSGSGTGSGAGGDGDGGGGGGGGGGRGGSGRGSGGRGSRAGSEGNLGGGGSGGGGTRRRAIARSDLRETSPSRRNSHVSRHVRRISIASMALTELDTATALHTRGVDVMTPIVMSRINPADVVDDLFRDLPGLVSPSPRAAGGEAHSRKSMFSAPVVSPLGDGAGGDGRKGAKKEAPSSGSGETTLKIGGGGSGRRRRRGHKKTRSEGSVAAFESLRGADRAETAGNVTTATGSGDGPDPVNGVAAGGLDDLPPAAKSSTLPGKGLSRAASFNVAPPVASGPRRTSLRRKKPLLATAGISGSDGGVSGSGLTPPDATDLPTPDTPVADWVDGGAVESSSSDGGDGGGYSFGSAEDEIRF